MLIWSLNCNYNEQNQIVETLTMITFKRQNLSDYWILWRVEGTTIVELRVLSHDEYMANNDKWLEINFAWKFVTDGMSLQDELFEVMFSRGISEIASVQISNDLSRLGIISELEGSFDCDQPHMLRPMFNEVMKESFSAVM